MKRQGKEPPTGGPGTVFGSQTVRVGSVHPTKAGLKGPGARSGRLLWTQPGDSVSYSVRALKPLAVGGDSAKKGDMCIPQKLFPSWKSFETVLVWDQRAWGEDESVLSEYLSAGDWAVAVSTLVPGASCRGRTRWQVCDPNKVCHRQSVGGIGFRRHMGTA